MSDASVITKEFDAIKTCLEVLVPLDDYQRNFALKNDLIKIRNS